MPRGVTVTQQWKAIALEDVKFVIFYQASYREVGLTAEEADTLIGFENAAFPGESDYKVYLPISEMARISFIKGK